MKVSITKKTKRWMTLEQAPIARKMVEDLKEDDGLKGYAEIAVNAAVQSNLVDLLSVKAEIAGNRRVWNLYSEESGTLDVWITITARTTEGYLDLGAYLSDIWQITGENADSIARHMYIRRFLDDLRIGKAAQTKRYGIVTISAMFESESDARECGYNNNAMYDGCSYKVFGKSKDEYHMTFCAVPAK